MPIRTLILQMRSSTVATCMAALIIGSAAWSMVGDVNAVDKEADTYHFIMPYLFSCDTTQLPQRDGEFTRNPLKWWINCASHELFHNYKVIPVVAGILIMPLVYILAVSITQDRLIGLVALVAFIYNPLYSDWATHGTYDQVWAFLLILGAVFLYRRREKLGLVCMLGSVLAKSMALFYMPLFLGVALYKRGIKAVLATILVLGMLAGIILYFGVAPNVIGAHVGFYPERWEEAVFRNISLFWQIIPTLLLFVGLNRMFQSSDPPAGQRTTWLWMGAAFVINPLVYLFTMQDTYSYRYVPLAAFMSIFIGQTVIQVGRHFAEGRPLLKKAMR